MGLEVDPGLLALFGSKDRVRTLAILANANSPLTAYRIARTAEVEPPNIYRELSKLVRVSEVRRMKTPEGEEGWALIDSDLQRLFRKRWRLTWSVDLIREQRGKQERVARTFSKASRIPLTLPTARSTGSLPARLARRRLEKDRILARGQARTSIRTKGSLR